MEKVKKEVFPFLPSVQLFLVVALVGVSFFAGTLWSGGKGLFGSKSAKGAAPAKVADTGAVAGAQAQAGTKSLSALAGELGVKVDDFKACLSSGEMAGVVSAGQESGTKAGVTGTPGVFLLDTQTGVSYFIPGAYPYEAISGLLADMKNGVAQPQLAGQSAEVGKNLDPVSDADHVRGDRSARYALIQYSDFECPFCKRFHETANKMVVDNADVMWVYRHYPLPMHQTAQKQAEASECVAKIAGNDVFWLYADALEKLDSVTTD